jgi:hypothetical protein
VFRAVEEWSFLGSVCPVPGDWSFPGNHSTIVVALRVVAPLVALCSGVGGLQDVDGG